jgi:hypothetical protein
MPAGETFYKKKYPLRVPPAPLSKIFAVSFILRESFWERRGKPFFQKGFSALFLYEFSQEMRKPRNDRSNREKRFAKREIIVYTIACNFLKRFGKTVLQKGFPIEDESKRC